MNQSPTVAFVFARGGSRGLPRKNLALLGGRPLITWSIEVALESSLIDRVIVSTDDEEIAEVARRAGAEVPWLRPAALATDDSPEIQSWQHAIRSAGGPIGTFVSLPATAPLRSVADVDWCIEDYAKGGADVVVTVSPAARNPYFNMVTVDEERRARLAAGTVSSDYIARRQDAPDLFDLTTVAYVANPTFVLDSRQIFDGTVRAVVIPKERALDIDDAVDLTFARSLLAARSASQ